MVTICQERGERHPSTGTGDWGCRPGRVVKAGGELGVTTCENSSLNSVYQPEAARLYADITVHLRNSASLPSPSMNW